MAPLSRIAGVPAISFSQGVFSFLKGVLLAFFWRMFGLTLMDVAGTLNTVLILDVFGSTIVGRR